MGAPRKTHCKHGHEFTPENTYVRDGHRSCRECRRRDSRIRMRAKYKPHPKPPVVMPRKTQLLAYAAGIIDGEGNIQIRLGRKSPRDAEMRWHSLLVRVTSTDPRLTDWLLSHFGGTVTISHHGKERQSPATNWKIHARRAEAFLRSIRPFLVIKRDQADVAIRLRETMGLNRCTPLTDEIFDYRESLRTDMRHLQTFRRLAPIEEVQK